MNKIFSLVLLSTVLLSLPILVFSFSLTKFDMAFCKGSLACHVECNDVGSLYHPCSVKTCTFSTSGTKCDGSCNDNDVLAYDEDRICKFSCGNNCLFSCSTCRRSGPNPPDWYCSGCK